MKRLIKLNRAEEGKTFEEKVAYSINKIQKENKDYHILKLTFYVNSLNESQYVNQSESIVKISKAFFKENTPAITVVSLSANDDFIIESILHTKDDTVLYKKLFDHHYTTVEYNNSTELFSGAISFNEKNSMYALQKTFDFTEQLLDAESMTFDALYKQNNYFSNISEEQHNSFNEIVNFYYGGVKFTDGVPLNSFIGTQYGNCVVDIAALNYGDEQVKHKDIGKIKYINSAAPHLITVQASDKDDIELQTLDILNNVFSSLENVSDESLILLSDGESLKDKFSFVKVYVKNKSDMKIVSSNLNETLPDIPKLIIESEFIKQDQLLEIEANILI